MFRDSKPPKLVPQPKDSYQSRPEPDPSFVMVRKERRCLMCSSAFQSAWAGERICAKCRGRSNWREGFSWPSGGRSG